MMIIKESTFNSSKLSIIILNFNGLEDTLNCISSLEENTKGVDYSIIVVENNSLKKFTELHAKKFRSQIDIINNITNRGFAGGCNDGIKFAIKKNSRYILLLNNDTVLTDNSINILIEEFENLQDKLTVLGPVNYFPNSNRVWQAGIYNNLKTGKTKTIVKPNFDVNRVEVDYVSGSCFLTSVDAFKKNGLFDENYFAYGEENDWCLSLKKMNGKVYVLNNAKIYHNAGASSTNIVKTYLKVRNRFYIYNKYSAKKYIPFIFIRIILLFLYKTLQSESRILNIKSIFYGVYDYFTNNMNKGRIDRLN